MIRKLLTSIALSGIAAASVAADSNFLADELRGLHSDLTSAHRWVDSDIRANLSHRWKTAPGRLTDVGLNFAEAKLEGVSWLTDVDLRQETDSDGKWTGFGASGTGLLWTGDSFAFGMQPSAEWTDGGGGDSASFGVFGRRALGDWGVLGANVFGDYSQDSTHGDFSRWSLGADFQSALAEVRGNWYSGSAGFRERWSEDGRVFAYAPSGVDAELRLRWSGDSEWTGFAEYEKWDGRFGNADNQEVGYGLTYRPLGGGLLSGLQVDAGYRDSADSADGWDLRVGYSRVLGGDNYARKSDFGFGVRSALVSPVDRADIRVDSVTARYQIFSPQARAQRLNTYDGFWVYDYPPYFDWDGECDLMAYNAPVVSQSVLAVSILAAAGDDSQFDLLCDTIRSGVNVNTRNGSGESALHLAVGGNAVNNVKLLLAASMIDADVTDNNGNTALDFAQIKTRERRTPQARATARTVAMVLRAEGVSCRRRSGVLCNIDYSPVLDTGDDLPRLLIFAALTVTSNVEGVIYQFHVPGWEDAVISVYPPDHSQLLTMVSGNRVSVIEGANLLRMGSFRMVADVYYPNGQILGGYYLYVVVEDARISPVWTTPEVRRTIPYYTGVLFTLTVLSPVYQYVVGFENNGEGVVSREVRTRTGYFDYPSGIGPSLFHAPPVTHSPNGFTFRSPGHELSAHNRQSVIVVSATRDVTIPQPIIDDIKILAWARNHLTTQATFAFTIAAVNIPPRLNFTVTAGHTGWIGAIPNDDLRNVNYRAVGTPSKLTLHRRELRIGSALDIGESSILTIALTSPDLVGTMTIIANVVANCDFTPGYGGYVARAGYSHTDRRNHNLYNGLAQENIEQVCLALKSGANPNARWYGASMFRAFYTRIRRPHMTERMVRLLLDSGGDPSLSTHTRLPNNIDSNALHMFAGSSYDLTGIFDLLIDEGVNLAGRDNLGYSPVMKAIESRQDPPKNFDYLLFHGAPPYKYSPLGRRAVLSGKGYYKWSALHIAIGKVQQLHKIESLLTAGANVNWQDYKGWTPLMYAIYYRNEAAVRALLTRRHDLTVENNDGETAYQIARNRNLRKIKCLLLAHQERIVDSCSQFM